jgi:hypothetical protein
MTYKDGTLTYLVAEANKVKSVNLIDQESGNVISFYPMFKTSQ